MQTVGWDEHIVARGFFLGTRTAIPAMRNGGGGSIINTSSVMGLVGSRTSPAYSVVKGAIATFTKSAALRYAKENIRINSMHPGYADTPLTMKRFSDPARAPGAAGSHADASTRYRRGHRQRGVIPSVRRIILGHRLGTGD
jgi:NAD(P)-dependent dehydrogenase (short-subunit alcohol dehydrogenase family)